MTIIRCSCDSCVNKGQECCTEKRIEINCDGYCSRYMSYEDFMRRKPKNDKKY